MFINQERKLGDRRRSDTVVVLTINDVNQGLDKNTNQRTVAITDCYGARFKISCSELDEKSGVNGLQGKYGHKAET